METQSRGRRLCASCASESLSSSAWLPAPGLLVLVERRALTRAELNVGLRGAVDAADFADLTDLADFAERAERVDCVATDRAPVVVDTRALGDGSATARDPVGELLLARLWARATDTERVGEGLPKARGSGDGAAGSRALARGLMRGRRELGRVCRRWGDAEGTGDLGVAPTAGVRPRRVAWCDTCALPEALEDGATDDVLAPVCEGTGLNCDGGGGKSALRRGASHPAVSGPASATATATARE